jgi:hypothetical protein
MEDESALEGSERGGRGGFGVSRSPIEPIEELLPILFQGISFVRFSDGLRKPGVFLRRQIYLLVGLW